MALKASRSSRYSSVGRFRLPRHPSGSLEIVHAARPCRRLIVVSPHARKLLATEQFHAGDRVCLYLVQGGLPEPLPPFPIEVDGVLKYLSFCMVHPRACGAYNCAHFLADLAEGPSPWLRGMPGYVRGIANWTIPAGAGPTDARDAIAYWLADHPLPCGACETAFVDKRRGLEHPRPCGTGMAVS